MKKIVLVMSLALATLTTANAQQMDQSIMNSSVMNKKLTKNFMKLSKHHPKVLQLDQAMRELWYTHMYWTMITVDAFYHDPKGLQAKLIPK